MDIKKLFEESWAHNEPGYRVLGEKKMPRLQDENNRYLSAMQEGMVSAIITLYDKGLIPHNYTRYDDIANKLTVIGLNIPEVDYWLDWFGVKYEKAGEARSSEGG